MGKRWIDQLNEFYWKIVNNPTITVENLDKANDIICKAIEQLRPLTKLPSEPPKMMKSCLNCGNDEWFIEMKTGTLVFTCKKCGYAMSAEYTKLHDFT